MDMNWPTFTYAGAQMPPRKSLMQRWEDFSWRNLNPILFGMGAVIAAGIVAVM